MPALEVDGAVIPESEVICEYLEDVYPGSGGLLGGTGLGHHG
jgi:glutathione S-transferase